MKKNLSLNSLGTRFEYQGKQLTVTHIKKTNLDKPWKFETEMILCDDNGNEYWNCYKTMKGMIASLGADINYNLMSGWVYVYEVKE